MDMLDVQAARQLILSHARPIATEYAGLGKAFGRVLAEPIRSSVKIPPFAKSKMDGFAVRVEDLGSPPVQLRVVERIGAGQIPQRSVEPGTAIQIMTGAVVPSGTTAVVRREDTTWDATAGMVQIHTTDVPPGHNIIAAGDSVHCGQTLLSAGQLLGPVQLGMLAEVGTTQVPVHRRPRVAIVATGDEIVSAEQAPGLGQIRNSNSPLLAALVRQDGGRARNLGIAADHEARLAAAVSQGLRAQILLLSGGVSVGDFDLVPSVLQRQGVRRVVHGLNLKPGKPMWFGIFEHGASHLPCLVFGLPGNPVSGLVCYHLFVRPTLHCLSGRQTGADLLLRQGELAVEFNQRSNRPTYWPARQRFVGKTVQIEPLPWKGSHDLCTLLAADCLAIFPEGRYRWPAGHQIEFSPLSP